MPKRRAESLPTASFPHVRSRSAKLRKLACQELHAAVLLSDDLLALVLAHLDPASSDGARAAAVCHRWHRLLSNALAQRTFLTVEGVSGGVRGQLLGELALPSYLTPLPHGDILVCDTYNNRCIRISALGEHKPFLEGVVRPRGAAIDAANSVLYVAEFTRHRVRKLHPSDGALLLNGPEGAARADAPWYPEGLALGGRFLFCADSKKHRVLAYDKQSLRLSHVIGSSGSGPGQLLSPCAVACSTCAQPQLFVCDKANHRISVFTFDGKFIRSFGQFGTAPGRFREPYGLALAHGRVYVSEAAGFRVQALTTRGEPLDAVVLHGCGTLAGICAVGPRLFVADVSNHAIHSIRAIAEMPRTSAV
ncbi:hypothetical protein AB1Y20_005702 [Prymnesium parvum]|uniref:Peptidylamidoglycolate lyase n=1 Tax=Prymnesium parvum TaxID=97485 RepID=A0AB34J1Y7_PRYPA